MSNRTRRGLLGVIGAAGIAGIVGYSSLNGVEPDQGPNTVVNPSEPWPQFQAGPRHTGVGSEADPISNDPVPQWDFKSEKASRSGLIASEDYVIRQGRSYIRAFEKATGELAWHTKNAFNDKYRFSCDPVLQNGSVIFAGSNQRTLELQLVGISTESGTKEWEFTFDFNNGEILGLTVTADYLYIVSKDYNTEQTYISALSIPDRNIVWENTISFYDYVDRPVGMANGKVIYGGYMEYEATGSAPEEGTPAGGVTAVDAETGEKLWQTEVGGTQSPVTIADGTVYVAPNQAPLTDHYAEHQQGGLFPLIALDVDTGDVIWKFKSNDTPKASPAVTSDCVYIGLSKTLWAINTDDGSQEWNQELDRFVESNSPAIAGGTILIGNVRFGDTPCFVNAFDKRTGEKQWEQSIPEEDIADVITVDGAVYARGQTFREKDSETIQSIW